MTIDGIPDSDVSSDALTPEEAAAFEEMRSDSGPSKPEPDAEVVAEPEKPAAVEQKPEDKEPEVQKLVPHGAFEEERQRRKEAQRLLETERVERARIQGQLEALRAGKQPENLTPQEKADFQKDPVAAFNALQAKIEQREADDAKAATERAEFSRVAAIGQKHAERFAKTQPNFFDTKAADGATVQGAYSFMRTKAAEQLQARFPSATEDQIIAAVDATERNHIQECLQTGDNAAEKLWELAVAAGYKAPEPSKPTPPRAENGQFQKSEAERIADLEKAQRASRSLGSAPAGGGEPELGMEALANMDDAEFAAATSGDKWEKLHRKGAI